MKLYLAAPLFSEAERAFNLALADAFVADYRKRVERWARIPDVDVGPTSRASRRAGSSR